MKENSEMADKDKIYLGEEDYMDKMVYIAAVVMSYGFCEFTKKFEKIYNANTGIRKEYYHKIFAFLEERLTS